jgi:hypothetical protein
MGLHLFFCFLFFAKGGQGSGFWGERKGLFGNGPWFDLPITVNQSAPSSLFALNTGSGMWSPGVVKDTDTCILLPGLDRGCFLES